MPHFKEIMQLYFSAMLSRFAFRVTAACFMDKIGWTGSIRGPAQRMTARIFSRMAGL